MRRNPGRRVIAAVVVVLAVVLSACSSSDPEAIVDLTAAPTTADTAAATTAPPTTVAETSTSSTTTQPPPTATAPVTTTSDSSAEDLEAELLRVLVGEREAFLASVADPIDVSGQLLEPWVTAERLVDLQATLKRTLDNGTATRPGSVETLTVIVAEVVGPDAFVVVTCTTSDSTVYDVYTGAIIDDRLGYLTRSATIIRESGELHIAAQKRLTLSVDSPCD